MAQTVLVTKAPPGAPVELVVNGATVASTSADQAGDAKLVSDLSANTGKTEIDANVYVDVCADNNMRRVVIVERGQAAAAQPAGCDRRDSGALFLIRRVSTLVVNVGGSVPTVLLRQGRVRLGPRRIRRAPTGVVVFGGAGGSQSANAVLMACGNVVECSGDDTGIAYNVGLDVWLTRFLGAEVSYLKPRDVEATGSESTFTFNTAFEADVATVAGKVGVPLGPVRLYGKLGTTYHRATFTTTQTTADLTQTFELRTQGWSWLFGGGGELWLAPAFAVYGELGRAALKGSGRDGAEGALDERLTVYFIGARVRVLGQ